MILVSACLCGINCKYNGGNNIDEKVLQMVRGGLAIPVCPEQLGGLPTPRTPAEIKIVDGEKRVVTKDGRDVTENYQKGAQEVLRIAQELKIKKVILKKKSPSCGLDEIYDGTFSNNLTKGNGVTTDLLLKNDIEVENV